MFYPKMILYLTPQVLCAFHNLVFSMLLHSQILSISKQLCTQIRHEKVVSRHYGHYVRRHSLKMRKGLHLTLNILEQVVMFQESHITKASSTGIANKTPKIGKHNNSSQRLYLMEGVELLGVVDAQMF